MKKIVSLMLVLCLSLSLLGCGGDKGTPTNGQQPTNAQQQTEQKPNQQDEDKQVQDEDKQVQDEDKQVQDKEVQPQDELKEPASNQEEDVPTQTEPQSKPEEKTVNVPESDFEDQQFFYDEDDAVTVAQAEATAKSYLPSNAKETGRKENNALGFVDITYSDGTYEYLVRITYMPDGAGFDKEHVNILDIMLN